MSEVPLLLSVLFGLTTICTAAFFYKAAGQSKNALLLLACWLALQALLSISAFYLATRAMPPRFIFLLFPPAIFIIAMF